MISTQVHTTHTSSVILKHSNIFSLFHFHIAFYKRYEENVNILRIEKFNLVLPHHQERNNYLLILTSQVVLASLENAINRCFWYFPIPFACFICKHAIKISKKFKCFYVRKLETKPKIGFSKYC
ncbi:unnamed protein product [Orchesella dallaii]|uniref:Uncharacterized protein n=1 Tax=Orchesella dallaii TaxID=48710 RepID=A0ABP1PKU2_9HEXA